MPRYLILCQSKATARALAAFRDLLGGEALYGKGQVPDAIEFDPNACSRERGTVAYRTLVQRLEAAADLDNGSSVPPEVVVLVDSIRPMGLSAISGGNVWDHLIAMLILTFPEICWVFGVIQGSPDPKKVSHQDDEHEAPAHQGTGHLFPVEDHNLPSLLGKPHREPLLDPTGLREWVRGRTNDDLRNLTMEESREEESRVNTNALQLPVRARRAASIDEEADFALMHGYTAYRYGFRSDVITSWALMEHLFGQASGKRGVHGCSLLLEDMRLQFPDKPEKIHLSDLRVIPNREEELSGRAYHCPLLDHSQDTSEHRFLITTGQVGKDRNLLRHNEQYLTQKTFGRGAVLYKPVGGILDLWDKTRLTEELDGGSRPGNASGFCWPPKFQEEDPGYGHGAPGKLALVADTLLRRATQVRVGAATVVDLLRGAVLAVEATELLGGKTPNLTLAALALKYEFEVRSECAFVGAGYHFTMTRRLKELREEIRALAQWCHRNNRTRIEWDARTSVLGRLAVVFREAGQMEEEHACLVELRKLNRKLKRPRGFSALNPVAWLGHAVLSYGEWLLASFARIAWMTIAWLLILVAAVSLEASAGFEQPLFAVSRVISWFFGGNTEPSNDKQVLLPMILSWCGVGLGVFHIGILISYMYSLISRK